MPVAARVAGLRRFAADHAVGDLQEFRIFLHAIERRRIMPIQLAEAPGKGDVGSRGELLIAKQQDMVFVPGVLDGLDHGGVQVFGQVDPGDLRAQRVAEGAELKVGIVAAGGRLGHAGALFEKGVRNRVIRAE